MGRDFACCIKDFTDSMLFKGGIKGSLGIQICMDYRKFKVVRIVDKRFSKGKSTNFMTGPISHVLGRSSYFIPLLLVYAVNVEVHGLSHQGTGGDTSP